MTARNRLILNSVPYVIATDKNGARLWTMTPRASQSGDPGDLLMAEWQVHGPDLTSFEQIPLGAREGFLGRDYGAGTDGRWGVDCLGPLINTITLSTFDDNYAASIFGTASARPGVTLRFGAPFALESAHGQAEVLGPAAVPYAYIIRGTTPAKVRLDTMALTRSGEQLSGSATSIIATRAATGAREISIGMEGYSYRVLTTVAAAGTSDTWATNSSSQAIRIFGNAPDRIAGLVNQNVLGNLLTGSVTMAAPAWATVNADIYAQYLTPTGYTLDGRLWIVMTSDGPFMLDRDAAVFFPIFPETERDSRHGRNSGFWSLVGSVLLFNDGLRAQKGGVSYSIGPEMFEGNTSNVQGRPEGFSASRRWGYLTIYDEQNNRSYLLAGRPRRADDPHPYPVSWFVLAEMTALESAYVRYIGRAMGTRTNPTVMLGRDGNCGWFRIGRFAREIDDPNYEHAASGTTYLTELRRQPGVLKDVEAVEFTAGGDTAVGRTIIVAISLDGGTAQTLSTVSTTGYQRLLTTSAGVPNTAFQGGRTLKPEIRYITGTATLTPQVTSTLRVYYRIRPLTIRIWTITLELRDDPAGETAEEQEDTLYALVRAQSAGMGAVELQSWDADTIYVRVKSITPHEAQNLGGGASSERGTVRLVDLTLEEWQTAA